MSNKDKFGLGLVIGVILLFLGVAINAGYCAIRYWSATITELPAHCVPRL